MSIDFNPPKPSGSELERNLQLSIARGVRARDEANAIGGGINAETIGSPGPSYPIDPPNETDVFDYSDPRANRDPLVDNGVLAFPLVGFSNLWIEEREYALSACTGDGYPFSVTTIPPGLNRFLTQDEVDILNARYAP